MIMNRATVCALLVTFAVVPLGLWKIYVHYKKILEKQWRRIGTLELIVMYPLESLQGITTLTTAHCSIYGLANREFGEFVLDRSHLLYSKSTNTAVTLDSTLIKLPTEHIWEIVSKCWQKQYVPESMGITINYLGNPVFISPMLEDTLTQIRKNIKDCNKDLMIGLTHRLVRPELEPKTVEGMRYDGLESNFSSYTLINQTSLNDLKVLFKRHDLTYRNFLPNFVIDCPDYESYIEDGIEKLKIGKKVIFEEVKPCTHTKLIDINPQNGCHFSGLFEVLQWFRALKRLFPKLSDSHAPVFGINMKINSFGTGTVSTGDAVYAIIPFDNITYASQFKEIASHISKEISTKVSSMFSKITGRIF